MPDSAEERELSPLERQILTKIVDLTTGDAADALRAQLAVARFKEAWFEGSQSFDVWLPDDVPLDPTPATMSNGRRILHGLMVYNGEAAQGSTRSRFWPWARSSKEPDPTGEIFLWIIDGRLDALEYPWWTTDMPDRLPELEQLR